MVKLSIKGLLALGAFAIAAVVALYLFTLLGSGEQQKQLVGEAGQQPQAQAQAVDELAKFYPPDEVLNSLCSRYPDLPVGVVPCREAYDFVIKIYKASIVSFSLFIEDADGGMKLFTAGQPVAEGTRLLWYAALESGPAFKPVGANASPPSYKGVFLDAKDLSLVKEKT